MTRKHYERAALIVQAYCNNAADARYLTDIFIDFFREDNERFDEERFRCACMPGANVKARPQKRQGD